MAWLYLYGLDDQLNRKLNNEKEKDDKENN